MKVDSIKNNYEAEDTFATEIDYDERDNLDLEIGTSPNILLEQIEIKNFKKEIDRCYTKFLSLAEENGITSQTSFSPPIDKIITQEGFLKVDVAKEFSLTIDFREDKSLTEAKLDKFKELIIEKIQREKSSLKFNTGKFYPFLCSVQIRDKKDKIKKHNELVQQLDTAADAYNLNKNASALSAAMELGYVTDSANEKQCSTGEKRVGRLCRYAEAIMTAAVNGVFLEEIAKPLRDFK